jgi:pimeloyl-ACP methyl ester carboxylesterase
MPAAYLQLEIISRHPNADAKSTPLLFVHGSFTGAKIWDEFFLSYFAEQGYQAHAVSLRGHGASAGRSGLRWWSLADYVADLKQVVSILPRAPVLIGHSLGGMVVQKYLERHPASGAVLMASVPPHGLLPSLAGMMASNPLLLHHLGLIQWLGPDTASFKVMREALFSDHTPDATVLNYIRLFQGESQRVSLDMLGLDPLRLRRDLNIPLLVMGAEHDAFISAHLVEMTARYYRTHAVIFPKMAHAMMLEEKWEPVAEHLLGWLDVRFG